MKFIIENYRAITGPLVLDIYKHSLTPVIGINECGKTTILHAIFALDWMNDKLNRGRHLEDVSNLYELGEKDSLISAEIELTWWEFHRSLTETKCKAIPTQYDDYINKIRCKNFPNRLIINRNLRTKRYYIDSPLFEHKQLNGLLAKNILRYMPYILYFDDFRDSVEEEIEVDRAQKHNAKGWLSIIEQLFNKTDSSLSVFDLPGMEQRKRKGVLAKVSKKLNKTLTREWQNFSLDNEGLLNISIVFNEKESGSGKGTIKLDVIEEDKSGDEHFFFIRDRSKGFFWFFNFVMKLEFNPKVAGSSGYESIYLLDEPGSYLHASAQRKLCQKLRDLSKDNKVLYCTHSQYLLAPDIIPLNSIKIAEKDGYGKIELFSIHDYKGTFKTKKATFQPLMDALQVNPFIADFDRDNVLIVEGICDRYAIDMLKGSCDIKILPAVNADSAIYLISLMIAWQVNYRVLWDNDREGIKSKEKAEDYFGTNESNEKFVLLPKLGRSRKTILQDLFCGEDVVMIKEVLNMPRNTSFEKTLTTLYYSSERNSIVENISPNTKMNFKELLTSLGF